MKKVVRVGVVCLLLFSPLLSGCWDRREINDVAFVMASGVDRVGDKYRVALQIPLAGQLGGIGGSGGGGGTSGGKSWYVDSIMGDTPREAVDAQQKSVSRSLYFAHRRVLVVGEEMAKEGIMPFLDVARIPQNRLGAFMTIAHGEARDLLNVDAPTEQFPAEMMRELLQNSMIDPPMMNYVIETLLSEGVDVTIPSIRVDKTKPGESGEAHTNLRLNGLSIFKGDKLLGFLNLKDTSGLMWALGQAKMPNLTIPSPSGNGHVTVTFQEVTSKLTPERQGNGYVMKIKPKGTGVILENTSDLDTSADKNIQLIKTAVTKTIQTSVINVIKKLQTEYHADPVGFGNAIFRKDPEFWLASKKDWDKMYSTMPFQVEPQIIIEHVGASTAPCRIDEVDKK